MEKKYLVALTFFEKSNQTKKVSNFRKRFDSKFLNLETTIISLLPPISLNHNDSQNLFEDLRDICESHFFDDGMSSLKFNALDLYMAKDNVFLYLKPEFSSDLLHAQEHMYAEVQKYIPKNRSFKNPDNFLTLGRFQDHETLKFALDLATDEFDLPFNLPIKGIMLYEKNSKGWSPVCELASLTDKTDIFLQSEFQAV